MSKRKKRNRSQKEGGSTEQSNSSHIGHTPSTPSSYSGLDPMHTVRSASYMEGSFLRNLFTGQLKTRNPLYIIAMGVFGVGAILPTFCAIIELTTPPSPPVIYETEDGAMHIINNSVPFSVENLVLFVPIALVGVGLLINLVANIRRNYVKG